MVRDPIERMLSHYLHNVGGGYETRPMEEALADPDSAYVARSRYAMQLEPYLEAFERERGPWSSRNEELARRARRDDARASSSSSASTRLRAPSSSSASGRPAAASRTAASG